VNDNYEELEALDWLWADGLVDEIIDKLEQLEEKYKYTHVDLMLDQREYATSKGLLQEVTILGIPVALDGSY